MVTPLVAAVRRKISVELLAGSLIFVVFYIAFLVLLAPIQLRYPSDDTAHISELQQMNAWQWVWMRAQTWQPRLFSDFSFALLLFHLRAWKVLNAGVMTLLLWMIARSALYGAAIDFQATDTTVLIRRRFVMLAALVCPMMFLIHPNVITSGSVWFTGSLNYLWPLAAMLIGISPSLLALYGRLLPKPAILLPICLVSSLCASFTEQTAAVQVGLIVLVLIWLAIQHERVPRYLILQAIFVLLVSSVFFYGTLTSPRQAQHAEYYLFPKFADFTIFDKLMLGVNVYTTHLLHVSNILFLVLTCLIGLSVFRRVRRLSFRLLAFAPGAWVLLNTVPLPWGYTRDIPSILGGRPSALGFGLPGWLGYLDGVWPLSSTPSSGVVVLSIVAAACVLSMFPLLFLAFQEARDRYLAMVLYLASFLSGILIGFSPTVWASGSRPNFLSNFLLLLLSAMLLRNLSTAASRNSINFSPRTPWIYSMVLFLLMIFVIYVWHLYRTIFATNLYWWY